MTQNDKTHISVIPALPGYNIVYTDGEDDRTDVAPLGLDPVVAWRVETSQARNGEWISHTSPITIDGSVNVSNDWAVVRPDGVVDEAGYGCHEDVAAFLDAVRIRYAACKTGGAS